MIVIVTQSPTRLETRVVNNNCNDNSGNRVAVIKVGMVATVLLAIINRNNKNDDDDDDNNKIKIKNKRDNVIVIIG